MPLLIVAGLLIIYGIAALFSVSIHESFTTTLSLIARGRMVGDPSNYFYFFKQISNLVYALVVWWVLMVLPIARLFKKEKILIAWFILIIILQLSVFFFEGLNGARWWIDIPWLPSIQPSEFFKVAYVVFLARWLTRKKHLLHDPSIMVKYVIVHVILFFVFLLIPDLGTILVMGLTWLVMSAYAGVKTRYIWTTIALGSVTAMLGLTWLSVINNSFCTTEKLSDLDAVPTMCKFAYISRRFTVFLDPESDEDNRKSGRQNKQALIAIGWWWMFGQWYGKWLQKFGYIPEAQSDFIFAAFAEESGLLWSLITLTLFSLLAYYTLIKVPDVQDDYFKNIAIWLISLLIIQMFVNIGVNTRILPNTWLTLPFISYGGTALMANIITVVLLYKILYRPLK